MGRARIRAILESAKGVNPKDMSEIAQKARTIESFADLNNLDIYVTGSNSKFLSSDIVTEFRGRGDEIRMYP